ncbi:DUF3267 domain-containing protein [Corynebacterium lubricantis]|uniref:DUF3267 domain-containing protein n=1 Tax=Corynebacterium lubricantis TaxID=541095 RepID=UPI00036037C8|nr:DUF3267 domain-containing protein [Corynebacterium lubricantis]
MSSSATSQLPANYVLDHTINIQQDDKAKIQGYFIAIALVAFAIALLFDLPITSDWHTGVVIVITIIAVVVYLALHEATHGIVAKWLTQTPSTYSFSFPFLRTSNTGFLTRRGLAAVSLAPVAVWGVVLLLALLVVPEDFRMTLYILLALNFAGSSGDCIEAAAALKQPENTLLRDNGDELEVYLPA